MTIFGSVILPINLRRFDEYAIYARSGSPAGRCGFRFAGISGPELFEADRRNRALD